MKIPFIERQYKEVLIEHYGDSTDKYSLLVRPQLAVNPNNNQIEPVKLENLSFMDLLDHLRQLSDLRKGYGLRIQLSDTIIQSLSKEDLSLEWIVDTYSLVEKLRWIRSWGVHLQLKKRS